MLESVEGSAHEAGREDYLDTLDAAFDSLDQHLAGRPDGEKRGPHHLSPPPGRTDTVDPRSPGRRPATRPEDPPANAVFEVDDEWFAADDKAAAERRDERQSLAAEMGIHDVDLPARDSGAEPIADLDFDFGIEARVPAAVEARQQMAAEIDEVGSISLPEPPVSTAHTDMLDEIAEAMGEHAQPAAAPQVAPPVEPAPIAAPPVQPPQVMAPAEVAADVAAQVTDEVTAEPIVQAPEPSPLPVPVFMAPMADAAPPPAPSPRMADAFEELLAFEQGEPLPVHEVAAPPPTAPMVVQVPAPEITPAMLDQIASQVADRLAAGLFGEQLRAAMTTTMRDTIRGLVSETSERLVREEIARVKAQAERES